MESNQRLSSPFAGSNSDSSSSPLSSPPDTPISTPFSSPMKSWSPENASVASEGSVSFNTRGYNHRIQLQAVKLPVRPKRPRVTSRKVADNISFIEQRRNTFFVAKARTVLPLLPEKNYVRELIEKGEYAHTGVRRYKKLEKQPERLNATLKPYQLEGLSFLLYLRKNGIGGILGDEMGLGKTIQTLAFFQYVKQEEDAQLAPFLVVCPLSIMDTWMTETYKWTPDLALVKYHGSPEQREDIKTFIVSCRRAKRNLPDIVVTTYETLLTDIAWLRVAFVWKGVVLDEGHHIKNAQARRSKALQQIKTEFKLVLTGTPVQNNLEELWAIFHWLYPTIFEQSSSVLFKDAFSLSDGKVDRVFINNAKRFLELIMLRRVKDSDEIGIKLPEKTEIILSIPLADVQNQWYLRILTGCDQLLSTFSTEAQNPPTGSSGHLEQTVGQLTMGTPQKNTYKIVQNMLMELRKCSIHPYMVEQAFPDPYVVGNDMVLSSGKFIVLATMIREFVMIQKQKVIVFAGFDQALNLCEDLLEHIQDSGRGFEYARIDGRTSSAWRNLGIYLFNNDPKYKVFLISIRAGGEGLNLSSASTVIFLDEDWNPQVMRQAEARVHRIGQKKQVRVFKMYSRGTIEEQMVCRLAKKTYLAEKVTEKLKTLKSLNELAAVVEQDAVSNNANGSTTVIASFLASLIRQRRLAENPIDVKKLLSWGWEAVLEVCGDGQKNELETPEDIPEDMELEWLRSKEHIRTNVFNGVRIKKAPRNAGPEDPPQTPRADRRIGKERIVELEGYQVTKENLRLGSCEASPRSPTTPSRKDPIVHDRVCFLCQHTGASKECQSCPRNFHQECLAAVVSPSPYKTVFFCPNHYCFGCQKTACQVGQLLYCCKSCVRAYCEECLDWPNTAFIGTEIYKDLGYSPNASFYIECPSCNSSRKRKHTSDELGSNKRPRW